MPEDQTRQSRSTNHEPDLLSAKEFRRCLKRAEKRSAKRLRQAESDLKSCAEAPHIRRQAEALKAGLNKVGRGMKEVVLPDYAEGEPDSTIRIELDPARPPRETMRSLFKTAAKLEKNTTRLTEHTEACRKQHSDLTELLLNFDKETENTEGEEPVGESFLSRAEELGVTLANKQNAKESKASPINGKQSARERLMKSVRIFNSADKYEILVGKSSKDNDVLSFRIARGNDIWFHLAATSGSHVVVRNVKSGPLPQETLLDAATLAVHFSKMRTAPKAEVHYTEAKHVRRIRGAPPGKVRIERNRTMTVRMEKTRLERLVKKTIGNK